MTVSETLEPGARAADSPTLPFHIVLNVGSGHGDAATAQRTIAAVLDRAGRAHEFFVVDSAERLAQQIAHAVAAARRSGGAVIAAGGDGTINSVAQAVLAADLPFGVLPQGTFNYFGRAHGISVDTAEAAQALLDSALAPAQVGLVNERIFLVNASLGLYPRVLQNREADKQRLGRFRIVALWSALKTLLQGYRRLRLDIERDGAPARLVTTTLFVGNNPLQLRQIGIAEADAQRLGYLIAVAPQPVGRLAMLGLLLRALARRLGASQTVDSFAFRELRVNFARRPRRRVKIATDGEIVWLAPPVVFRVSPRPLRLLLPPQRDREAG